MTFRAGCICTGIGVSKLAWAPLGVDFDFCAEVEAFPCAVLSERFGAGAPRHYLDPSSMPPKDAKAWTNNNRELDRMIARGDFPAGGNALPNLGDFTKIDASEWPDVEWLIGGPPCQDFSIAGARAGLDGRRGNLTLAYVDLVHDLAANGSLRGAVYENVPGLLSDKGNAFGNFLAAIVGHDAPIVSPHRKGRWTDVGLVVGPRARAAWRVLDSQYFGLAQRRRRLFVVIGFGDRTDPARILFEPQGVRRSPPSRGVARQDVAPTLSARTSGGGGLGTDFDLDGGVVAVAPTLRAGGNVTGGDRPPGTDVDTIEMLVPIAFNSREELVSSTEVFGALGASHPQAQAVAYSIMPMNSGKDFKARLTDVAQPVMAGGPVGGPVGGNQGGDYIVEPLPFDTTQITSAANRSSHKPGDPCHPVVAAGHAPAIAFSIRGRDGEAQIEPEADDLSPALRTGGGGSDKSFVATLGGAIRWAVRRLMPTECEALQGVPRNFTRIPWRGKPAEQCPDGPRYKGLGNAFSREPVEWIGKRIIAAEAEADHG